MKENIFSLRLTKKKIIVKLKIKNTPLNTQELPLTLAVLKKHLPSVFSTKCYNSKKQSFLKEARKTETPHLFEHILLEYMCLKKIEYESQASYSGWTTWDKTKNDGKFKIEIDCTLADWPIFLSALNKGNILMNLILASNLDTSSRGQSYL